MIQPYYKNVKNNNEENSLYLDENDNNQKRNRIYIQVENPKYRNQLVKKEKEEGEIEEANHKTEKIEEIFPKTKDMDQYDFGVGSGVKKTFSYGRQNFSGVVKSPVFQYMMNASLEPHLSAALFPLPYGSSFKRKYIQNKFVINLPSGTTQYLFVVNTRSINAFLNVYAVGSNNTASYYTSYSIANKLSSYTSVSFLIGNMVVFDSAKEASQVENLLYGDFGFITPNNPIHQIPQLLINTNPSVTNSLINKNLFEPVSLSIIDNVSNTLVDVSGINSVDVPKIYVLNAVTNQPLSNGDTIFPNGTNVIITSITGVSNTVSLFNYDSNGTVATTVGFTFVGTGQMVASFISNVSYTHYTASVGAILQVSSGNSRLVPQPCFVTTASTGSSTNLIVMLDAIYNAMPTYSLRTEVENTSPVSLHYNERDMQQIVAHLQNSGAMPMIHCGQPTPKMIKTAGILDWITGIWDIAKPILKPIAGALLDGASNYIKKASTGENEVRRIKMCMMKDLYDQPTTNSINKEEKTSKRGKAKNRRNNNNKNEKEKEDDVEKERIFNETSINLDIKDEPQPVAFFTEGNKTYLFYNVRVTDSFPTPSPINLTFSYPFCTLTLTNKYCMLQEFGDKVEKYKPEQSKKLVGKPLYAPKGEQNKAVLNNYFKDMVKVLQRNNYNIPTFDSNSNKSSAYASMKPYNLVEEKTYRYNFFVYIEVDQIVKVDHKLKEDDDKDEINNAENLKEVNVRMKNEENMAEKKQVSGGLGCVTLTELPLKDMAYYQAIEVSDNHFIFMDKILANEGLERVLEELTLAYQRIEDFWDKVYGTDNVYLTIFCMDDSTDQIFDYSATSCILTTILGSFSGHIITGATKDMRSTFMGPQTLLTKRQLVKKILHPFDPPMIVTANNIGDYLDTVENSPDYGNETYNAFQVVLTNCPGTAKIIFCEDLFQVAVLCRFPLSQKNFHRNYLGGLNFINNIGEDTPEVNALNLLVNIAARDSPDMLKLFCKALIGYANSNKGMKIKGANFDLSPGKNEVTLKYGNFSYKHDIVSETGIDFYNIKKKGVLLSYVPYLTIKGGFDVSITEIVNYLNTLQDIVSEDDRRLPKNVKENIGKILVSQSVIRFKRLALKVANLFYAPRALVVQVFNDLTAAYQAGSIPNAENIMGIGKMALFNNYAGTNTSFTMFTSSLTQESVLEYLETILMKVKLLTLDYGKISNIYPTMPEPDFKSSPQLRNAISKGDDQGKKFFDYAVSESLLSQMCRSFSFDELSTFLNKWEESYDAKAFTFYGIGSIGPSFNPDINKIPEIDLYLYNNMTLFPYFMQSGNIFKGKCAFRTTMFDDWYDLFVKLTDEDRSTIRFKSMLVENAAGKRVRLIFPSLPKDHKYYKEMNAIIGEGFYEFEQKVLSEIRSREKILLEAGEFVKNKKKNVKNEVSDDEDEDYVRPGKNKSKNKDKGRDRIKEKDDYENEREEYERNIKAKSREKDKKSVSQSFYRSKKDEEEVKMKNKKDFDNIIKEKGKDKVKEEGYESDPLEDKDGSDREDDINIDNILSQEQTY